MERLTVTIPDAMQAFIQAEMASGGYRDPNDYICHLLRSEQQRKAAELLERLVHEGLESSVEDLPSSFWDDLRRRAAQKAAAREAKACFARSV